MTSDGERCGCCGRPLPRASDPPFRDDVRIGMGWLRGRLLFLDGADPVRLPPTQARILSLIARRPAGVTGPALAAAIGVNADTLKVQVCYLRTNLRVAEMGVGLPSPRVGRENHALYRFAETV